MTDEELLQGIILNATGFGYIMAKDPDRLQQGEENVEATANEEEMGDIHIIASAVYTHVLAYLAGEHPFGAPNE